MTGRLRLESVSFGFGGPDREGLRVLFDLDDTLMPTQPLFDRATARSATLIEEALGVPADECVARHRLLDREAVREETHFDRHRYALSWQATAAFLAAESGLPLTLALQEALAATAEGIWHPPYETYPATVPVLRELASMEGIGSLDVLTLGDPSIQRQKLAGLPRETHALIRRVLVVTRKDAEAYRDVAEGRPGDCVMVGNSLRSDITPSLEAGLWAVHVDHHSWSIDGEATPDTSSPRFRRAADLGGVPERLREVLAARG